MLTEAAAPELNDLRSARAGDLAAFERLVRAYERQVYGTALKLLGNREDAQDAAQETFVRLYRHLARIDETRLAAWLYRVTVNVCRDTVRRRVPSAGLPETQPAPGPDPLSQLSDAERRALLQAGLRRLTEKERAAVVLRDLEGLPTREVARILGATEVTLRSRLSTARMKLKKYVEQRRWR